MFGWILAALAALGLLSSGTSTNKSGSTTAPGDKHAGPITPDDTGGGSSGGGSTDGKPPGH